MGISLQPPEYLWPGRTLELPVNELTLTFWAVNGAETPQTQPGLFLQSRDDAALLLWGPWRLRLSRKAELSAPVLG